jgi:hypothetical protein
MIAHGQQWACPRCGALFIADVAGPLTADPYRNSHIAELVPLRERPPWGLGVRIESSDAVLDISIGGRLLRNRAIQSSVWLVLLIAFMNAESTCAGAPLTSLFPLFSVLALLYGVAVEKSSFERVTLDHDCLRLATTRFAGKKEVRRRVVELARIVRVRDISDHIVLELDDGTTVELGDGLNVPRRVVRWLVRRIRWLVRRAPQLSRALPDHEPVAFDPDRRLCTDETCLGVIGLDGRCSVCGRVTA